MPWQEKRTIAIVIIILHWVLSEVVHNSTKKMESGVFFFVINWEYVPLDTCFRCSSIKVIARLPAVISGYVGWRDLLEFFIKSKSWHLEAANLLTQRIVWIIDFLESMRLTHIIECELHKHPLTRILDIYSSLESSSSDFWWRTTHLISKYFLRDTKHSPNAGLLLGQHLQRWPGFETTLDQCSPHRDTHLSVSAGCVNLRTLDLLVVNAIPVSLPRISTINLPCEHEAI